MKIKYPYSIRVLEERLVKERKYLEIFNKPTRHLDWQKANVDSCEHRINELVETIEHLKNENS